MKALAISIKTKQQHSCRASIGIKVFHSDNEVICQFCRKPRRLGRSFLFQGVPECLGLQLLPFKAYYHKALVRHGFNPRLEIYLPPNKLLAEVIEHLNKRWNPTYLENDSQEFVISLKALWQGKYIEYTRTSEKISIGDIFLSLECPLPLQLCYYWKPMDSSFIPTVGVASDYSVGSSMLLIDENSNSLPFLSTTGAEPLPKTVNSPFKTLFRAVPNPFSKEDASDPKAILKEESILMPGESSLFSSILL